MKEYLFECYNCGTSGIFKNVVEEWLKNHMRKCPVCAQGDNEDVYFSRLLTEDEAIKKARAGESDGVVLVDMNCGWPGSRTYEVRGYDKEVTI